MRDIAKSLFYEELEKIADSQSYIWAFDIRSKVVDYRKVEIEDTQGVQIEFEITGEFEFLENELGDFKFKVMSEYLEDEKEAVLYFLDDFSGDIVEESDFERDFWFHAYLGHINRII